MINNIFFYFFFNFFYWFFYWFRILLSCLWVIISIYLLPGLIFWFFVPSVFLWIPYTIGVMMIIITNIFLILQLIVALYRKIKSSKSRNISSKSGNISSKSDIISVNRISIIIPAYISNEIFIIDKSIRRVLEGDFEDNNVELIISYNGSNIENCLLDRLLEKIIDDIKIEYNFQIHTIYYETSKSKSENICSALDFLMNREETEPDFVFIFDADHCPNLDCITKGISYLLEGDFDIIQGRNIINTSNSITDNLIGVEFDYIYGVEHPAMEILRGFAIFGGSNSVWRYGVLNHIRMKNRLTEDIDATFRSLSHGYKIGFCPEMISFEQAPNFPFGLFWQRLRWAQGWFECSLIHTRLAFDPRASFGGNIPKNIQRRFSVVFMLFARELYYYLAALSLPAGIVGIIKTQHIDFVFYILLYLTILIFIFPFLTVMITMIIGKEKSKLKFRYYLLYCFVSPFYELIKYHIAILAHARMFLWLKTWNITERKIF